MAHLSARQLGPPEALTLSCRPRKPSVESGMCGMWAAEGVSRRSRGARWGTANCAVVNAAWRTLHGALFWFSGLFVVRQRDKHTWKRFWMYLGQF